MASDGRPAARGSDISLTEVAAKRACFQGLSLIRVIHRRHGATLCDFHSLSLRIIIHNCGNP